MKGIAVNNHKLHEVRMLLSPYSSGGVSYLRYPKNRILFELNDDGCILRIPSLLALELYRKLILPQNPEGGISIKMSGKDIGVFHVVDFRYPNNYYEDRDMVKISLRKRQKLLNGTS